MSALLLQPLPWPPPEAQAIVDQLLALARSESTFVNWLAKAGDPFNKLLGQQALDPGARHSMPGIGRWRVPARAVIVARMLYEAILDRERSGLSQLQQWLAWGQLFGFIAYYFHLRDPKKPTYPYQWLLEFLKARPEVATRVRASMLFRVASGTSKVSRLIDRELRNSNNKSDVREGRAAQHLSSYGLKPDAEGTREFFHHELRGLVKSGQLAHREDESEYELGPHLPALPALDGFWLFDVNADPAERLKLLPDFNLVKARKLVADRESQGPFQTPADLLRLPLITPETLERMRAFLTFPIR
jgi:hypothetical protein